MNKDRKIRNCTGSIVEFGGVLVLIVPLVMLLLFATYEFAYAFLIKSNIDNAAKNAARAMAIQYGQDSSLLTDSAAQQAVYSSIRIPNFVHANQQFSNPVFKPAADPTSVTVSVTYTGGQNGLPQFPNPDLLKLGANFKIDGTYTYRLESQ